MARTVREGRSVVASGSVSSSGVSLDSVDTTVFRSDLAGPVERDGWLFQLDAAWAPRARLRAKIYRCLAEHKLINEAPEVVELPPSQQLIEMCAARGLPAPAVERVVKWNMGGWYRERADSLAVPLASRLRDCGTFIVKVGSRCGRDAELPVGCGVRWLCDSCRRTAYKRLRRRALRAVSERLELGRRRWQTLGGWDGGEPRPVLITLTVRHSGDVPADRERIRVAWEKTRQWLWRELQKAEAWGRFGLRRKRDAPELWTLARGKFDYALTWEATPGRDERGHPHAHVVALLPRVSWAKLRRQWIRATAGESTHIDLRNASAPRAADYIAKYASKGVSLDDDWEPQLAADVLDAFWSKRKVSASRGFWLPEEHGCDGCGSRIGVGFVGGNGAIGLSRGPCWLVEAPGVLRVSEPVWRTHAAVVVSVVEVFDDEEKTPPRRRSAADMARSFAAPTRRA